MTPLKETIRAEFRRVLDERKLTVAAAAKQLGISRQAFHSYLDSSKPTIPRMRTLSRAMQLWDLRLTVAGVSFDKGAFPSATINKPQAQSQMSLLEMLDSIKQEDLRFTVKRVGKSLRVALQIDIPA